MFLYKAYCHVWPCFEVAHIYGLGEGLIHWNEQCVLVLFFRLWFVSIRQLFKYDSLGVYWYRR